MSNPNWTWAIKTGSSCGSCSGESSCDFIDPSWLSVSPLELDLATVLAEINGDTLGSADRGPGRSSVWMSRGGSVLVDATGRSRCGT